MGWGRAFPASRRFFQGRGKTVSEGYTEVTHESWFGRITAAIKGVLIGVTLFLASFVVLYWNEGRAVSDARNLEAGAAAVVSVSAEIVDAANEGNLVHMTGKAIAAGQLADTEFAMTRPGVIALARKVEMYQCIETKHKRSRKKLGGGKKTTIEYTYKNDWSGTRVDSSRFSDPDQRDTNPKQWRFSAKRQLAKDVTVGAFKLRASQVGEIGGAKPIGLVGEPFAAVQAKLGGDCQLADGKIYLGKTPATPAIGDMRIWFEAVESTDVSIMAQQAGSSFTAFATPDGTIDMLDTGVHSADAMLAAAEARNQTMTWIFRLVGFLMMLIGVLLVTQPLVVVADVVPFIGDVLGVGAFLVALMVAVPLSLLTISVAWLVFRPILGIALLLAGVVVAYGIKSWAKKRRASRSQSAA